MKRLFCISSFSVTLMAVVFSPFLGLSQEWNSKLIPRVNDDVSELSRRTGMDYDNYFLLMDVFNAIDSLDSRPDATFLSDAERIAVKQLRLDSSRHLFLQAEAIGKGIQPDNDALFAMAASRSKEFLQATSELLGPKMATVVQTVNQRRIADLTSAGTVLGSENIGKLLELNPGQREQLAELSNRFIAESNKSNKALTRAIDELSLRYRKLMLEKLDTENRKWYTEAFGDWMQLIDESGKPHFGDLVDHYDFAESNPQLESVYSIVRTPSEKDDRRASGEEQAIVHRTIKMDAIISALLKSEKVRKEINLSESQIGELDHYFSGVMVVLSNQDRDRRLRELMSLANSDNLPYQSSWSNKQKCRFSQLELQIRTSGNWSSFGILDDEVSRHMGLSIETRAAIRALRDDFVYELNTLIADQREAMRTSLQAFKKAAFALLDQKQQAKFIEYFGTDYFSQK